MDYKITIDNFEGPLDLLLHLIKQSDIEIKDISILEITKQYLSYIEEMEELNLTIASEYLVMAASLIEMKSSSLLPRKKVEESDEYEDDPKELLIKRLLEYETYKKMTEEWKQLEEARNEIYTKLPEDLREFRSDDVGYEGDAKIDDLLKAFQEFMARKSLEKPLNTRITKKELSVATRIKEIKIILKHKKRVEFEELFEVYNKEYVVVTFLSILNLSKKGELFIKQEDNFSKIYIEAREEVSNES